MKRLFGEERGQALVEFAHVLPIFLLLIVGLFDLGRAVFQLTTLAFAAREGTRYAIVHGEGSDSPVGPGTEAPVIAVVQEAAIGVANVTATVTWPDIDGYNPGPPVVPGVPCTKRNCRVQVDATAPFRPMFTEWFGVNLNLTLRGGSVLVIQR
jgi:Flp pilus assembly protein TadG